MANMQPFLCIANFPYMLVPFYLTQLSPPLKGTCVREPDKSPLRAQVQAGIVAEHLCDPWNREEQSKQVWMEKGLSALVSGGAIDV